MTDMYLVTRDVTPEECHWLDETVPKDSIVYRCFKPTYGAISPNGLAVSYTGDYPCFELPHSALEPA